MTRVTGYAAHGPGGPFRSLALQRRDLRDDDVAVRISHVGVCHSDLHAVEALAADAPPLVPGHEFVGQVAAVGPAVTRFAVGDRVPWATSSIPAVAATTASRAGRTTAGSSRP